MTESHWLSSRMLEFNFLPSCTLHPSRFDSYAMPGLARAIEGMPDWRASWHRHWSHGILRTLDVGIVADASQRSLRLALMGPNALTQLARRVGVVLCIPKWRSVISGEGVRTLRSLLGDELMGFARRNDAIYVDYLPRTELTPPDTLEGIERLGYATVMACLSECSHDLTSRVELKLPLGTLINDSPLSASQTWPLCEAVLKDMDGAWCSLFPETL